MTLVHAPLAIQRSACPFCGVAAGVSCVFNGDDDRAIRSWRRPIDSPIPDDASYTRGAFATTCHEERLSLWLYRNDHSLEVERCHAALDSVYESLRFLEPTLTLEQIHLLPINECKYQKTPEWEDRYAYRQSKEGQASHLRSLRARVEQLREAFPDAPIPPMDDE